MSAIVDRLPLCWIKISKKRCKFSYSVSCLKFKVHCIGTVGIFIWETTLLVFCLLSCTQRSFWRDVYSNRRELAPRTCSEKVQIHYLGSKLFFNINPCWECRQFKTCLTVASLHCPSGSVAASGVSGWNDARRLFFIIAGLYSTVDRVSDCKSWACEFESQAALITSTEIDHETFQWPSPAPIDSRRCIFVSYR